MSHIYFPEGKSRLWLIFYFPQVMLLTNQVPRLVSSHIETRRFLSHALRNKLNCNEREMAEVARPYEWNDRKSNHKAVF